MCAIVFFYLSQFLGSSVFPSQHKMVLAQKKRPSGRPKRSVTETLDVADLHRDWDSSQELRARLRDGQGLLKEYKSEDITSTVDNVLALQPLITRMSLTQSRPLPGVDALRDQVEQFYLKNKRGQSQEEIPDVIGISWQIRKFLGFVKMKARRKEVSSVPFPHSSINGTWVVNIYSSFLFFKHFLTLGGFLDFFCSTWSLHPRCLRFNRFAWTWTHHSRFGGLVISM